MRDMVLSWKALAAQLAERIELGEFPAGSRFPSGDVLAVDMGINRNTAHRAIEELQRQGLVVRRKGSGTIVADRSQTRQTRIALLVDGYSPVHNFPHGDLLRGIQDRLGDENNLILADSKHDVLLESRQLAKLQRDVDGILLYPTSPEQPSAKFRELVESGYPIVVLDRAVRSLGVDTVMTDNRGVTKKAISALIERGHRNIGFLSFDKFDFSSVEARHKGYVDAMEAAGLDAQSQVRWLPRGSDSNPAVFHQVVQDTIFALRHGPEPMTAVFCVEDQIGCAAVPCCERLGIVLPRDLDLVTFSDWHPMTLRSPWNVHRLIQRKLQLGMEAASLLFDRIAEPDRIPETRLIDADFVLADAGLEASLAAQSGVMRP